MSRASSRRHSGDPLELAAGFLPLLLGGAGHRLGGLLAALEVLFALGELGLDLLGLADLLFGGALALLELFFLFGQVGAALLLRLLGLLLDLERDLGALDLGGLEDLGDLGVGALDDLLRLALGGALGGGRPTQPDQAGDDQADRDPSDQGEYQRQRLQRVLTVGPRCRRSRATR